MPNCYRSAAKADSQHGFLPSSRHARAGLRIAERLASVSINLKNNLNNIGDDAEVLHSYGAARSASVQHQGEDGSSLTLVSKPICKLDIGRLRCQRHEIAFHTELCKSFLEKKSRGFCENLIF